MRQSTEFFIFYVKWWIMDPQVDSRPALFQRLLGSTVNTSVCVSLRGWSSWSRCTSRCIPSLSSGTMMLDIMAGVDQEDSLEVHRCSSCFRFSARCCATCGVMVQTVQYTVWRFRSCSSSRSSTLPFDALAVPHGPVCSENHRDSPVRIWWSMSLFAGSPQVQSWMDCSDSQLQPLTLGLGVQACKFHRCGL